ncbi:MAG: TetM/TetW/TetO/TetS family tetracycline resistance ribosomal protection protein, partial [Oscillospiraceae bacterium]|nr:TetM/TetW/TetO/TetS family tetracycline resistance ribosomal protection protein [Oscillospiraceae bacterium]
CCFGSALKLDGVEEFISCLERYTVMPEYPAEFGARVFKISRDEKGARLTHMKITGGSIRVKDTIPGNEDLGKIEQIRIYSGAKFTAVEQAQAGTVCAVTGLVKTRPFDVYGAEKRAPSPVLLPVMTYRLDLPEGENVHEALSKLRQLQEEEPELHIVWHERLREIHVQLMGKMQLDIVKDMILRRFGMEVSFGQGSVLYAETIQDAVEGVGHFEPLRHYAEVHLILTPLERGQGLVFDTECPEDALDRNWQRLVLTHLAEKTHLGVLTGSPITDMRITLAAGRAHLKHTEGGDFRQATYRAVRNALMRAKSVLLEPYYSFTLELPRESVGRAMTDIQQMGGQIQPPEDVGDTALLTGRAPAVCLADYAEAVNIYTKGAGRLTLMPDGYDVCHNSQEVIDGAGYDPRADLENTPDSVFCYHGSAETVSWDEVPRHMHIPFVMQSSREPEEPSRTVRREVTYSGTYEEDRELQRIFEMTYGQSKSTFLPRRQEHIPTAEDMLERTDVSDEYLLVDGYNVIHSWQELRQIAQESLDLARQALINVLSNYQGYTGKNVILVFDAYKVAGAESIEKHGGLFVVYTKESEIADVFIEKVTKRLGRELKDKYRVRVVTSDGLEQCITLAHGALRVPASSFEQEVEQVTGEIRRAIEGRK